MSRFAALKPFITVLAVCAALLFFFGRVGGAFMLVLVSPLLGLWLAYNAYVIWRRPEKRRIQLLQISIVLATGVAIAALHWYYAASARAAGNYALSLVNTYKALHGVYPDSLEDAGWKQGAYGGRWRVTYQGYGETKDPMLMYPATWIIFDMYDYDFKTKKWTYLAD
jgi:hypothetical protein